MANCAKGVCPGQREGASLLCVKPLVTKILDAWLHMIGPTVTLRFAFSCLLLSGAVALASTIAGTVTNKTNGKPSAGDSVVLVDVQAGMADAATTTTDARGHYSLESPGNGAYLIRVTHQGGTYFIGAPQGSAPGDVSVYDVAARVDGVSIDADMLLAEAGGGMLRVQERYLVRNRSLPPKAQFSSNTFEFVLPPEAILDGASATRPGGMATNTRPAPLAAKGHYTINVPIQPDLGEKETLFELQYHLPYSGTYTFTPQPQMPADNLLVDLPKSMTFTAQKGSFQPAQEDPRVQTFVAKGVRPGQAVAFSIGGEGQMPNDAQTGAPQASGGMGDSGDTNARPGGGIGAPIDTPDPLSKYKWWILAALALLLAATAAFLLRRQRGASNVATPAHSAPVQFEIRPSHAVERVPIPISSSPAAPSSAFGTQSAGNPELLSILRDELFAIESEKVSGTMSEAEYAEVKAGLEALLRRALRK